MIYSPDINKICALCRHSGSVTGVSDKLRCTRSNDIFSPDHACADFDYDIFKKPTRRKRRLKSKYKADDFRL